jgi:hypothetical protein
VTAANNLGNGPRRGVIYSIAPSPLDAKLLWIGTDDGLVWRSNDDGVHWTDVTPAAIGDWSKVGMLEASHFDRDVAYAAIDRHRLDDRKPYIYRTRDGGRSWRAIVAGIRDGDFVNAVREDPARRGLLYAATELGVYVSFDDGDHWQPMQMNLPRTSVRDLDVHGDDLIIATHGRGFWVLDDLSPVRQMRGTTADSATRLFRPSTAIRVRAAGFTGTPLPKEEPAAENPPFGARIDYVLATAATTPVQLSIRDAAGNVVRQYSSADVPQKHDAATAGTAPEWFTTPSTLATDAGLHRFIWPLRYPALPALAGGDAYADGAWAPPGSYSVALTVEGRTYTQPLTVAPDPRVHITADAYARQFAFARDIERTQARLAVAQAQAKRLHAAIKSGTGSSVTALRAPLAALDAKVIALAGLQEAPNPYNAWSAGSPGTRSLAFLSQGLGKVAQSADDADAEPSPDARSGYAVLAPIVDDVLGCWQRLLDTDLATVNAQLRAAGQAPLVVDAATPKAPH